ncbi:MAG: chromate transporter [Hydrogenophaga sp.]|nr:chromate transporter [Hydrogenophaga sp.]
MSLADWTQLLLFHLSISLLAVGGAITLVPDMHRFLASEQHWLTDLQFNHAVTLAQAAPGPNVLFVALVGWNVGHNAAGPDAGMAVTAMLAMAGALIGMLGVLAPSSLLTIWATRWCQRHRDRLGVLAFRQGMAPIVVGVLLATSWLLGRASGSLRLDAGLWLLTLGSSLLIWRTRLHLLWMLAAGAALGALGWV